MSEEVLEIVTDPPGFPEQDKVQQDSINLLLQCTRMLMGNAAHVLKCDMPKASAVMLSVLGTTVMVFIRGYPREVWAMQFREMATYFNRMADEAEQKGADNDGPTDPDS